MHDFELLTTGQELKQFLNDLQMPIIIKKKIQKLILPYTRINEFEGP